ncbi:MAG: kynureninase [Acidobacteria bacterium]|nr:kynureninase [Acidobacteriota bacterium]
MSFENTAQFAAEMDAADPLATFRERFHFPLDAQGEKVLYFTGNSLGLQPKSVREYVNQELDDWAKFAVEGHFHARNPWLPYHEFLAANMAEVVGALPIETVVMNSLTVNLHLLMVSFYRPSGKRCKIVIEKGAFPSDQYAVRSQLDWHNGNSDLGFGNADCLVELAPRAGESTLRTDDIVATIQAHGDEIALVMLGGVNYYTGQAFDFEAITKAGHEIGAVVGFDCAHAAGNLELKLHDWNVDFAAWCTYKYLNAGPGAIAGVFVHERHAERFDLPRFAGWWGHDKQTRFLMGDEFHPMRGAEGWQISNPPILQMAALRASLDVFHDAGMANLRAKSLKLTGFLEFLLKQIETDRIEIITPSDPAQRGCQLSIRVRESDRDLFKAITDHGVVADWREPDVIRIAPAPLYNSFQDVFRFSEILRRCLGL